VNKPLTTDRPDHTQRAGAIRREMFARKVRGRGGLNALAEPVDGDGDQPLLPHLRRQAA
jgi:hypothetical protein